MFALIKNEYIKIFKSRKNWAVLVLFLIFLGLMTFGQYKSYENMKEWNSLEYQKKICENNMGWIKEEIIVNKKKLEDGNTELDIIETIKELESNLKIEEEKIANYEKLISEGNTELDWRDSLKEEKQYLEQELKELESDGASNKYGKNIEIIKESDKERLEDINYYLDNNIKPLDTWDFNSYNIILGLFSGLGTILLILIIAVFIGDIVSGECTPPTLKFLVIQPVSRGKIIFAKFFASITSIVFAILSCQLITFIVVGCFRGFEAGKSIVSYGTKYQLNLMKLESGMPIMEKIAGTTEKITLNEFMIKALLMQVLYIVAISSVIFLISTIIKNNLVSMALSVILLVVMNVISMVGAISMKIGHLLFTNYGNIKELLTGDLAQMNNNAAITIEHGIIVMIITIIVSYVIAHIVFKKKDILI